MKKLLLQGLACVCFFTAAAAVVSRAQTVGLRADIPFSFNVDEKVLPPGNYLILAPSGQMLKILGSHGVAALAITNQVSGKPPASPGAVVFNCYGERCFLSRFWTSRSDTGQEVLKSDIEKRLASQKEMLAVISLRAAVSLTD